MKTENSPFKLELTYGIYFALISIVLNLLVWATAFLEKSGLLASVILGLVNFGILIGFLIICTKSYRDRSLNGTITFGQAYLFALMVVVFSSIITGLYSYIFYKFIDPDYGARVLHAIQEKTYQFMVNRGLPEDQIDAQMIKLEAQEIPTAAGALISSLKMGLIGGAIIALITSAIVKKNNRRDDFEGAMNELKSEE